MRPELLNALNADESTSFICSECETIFDKRFEICPKCKTCGTIGKIEITPKLYDEDFGFFEESEDDEWPEGENASGRPLSAEKVSRVSNGDQFDVKIKSCSSAIAGFDSLFGDKTIMGTLNLFIGAQSSGKTSFFLKVAEGYAVSGHKTLYISSEESSWQISDRLQRMNINSPGLFLNSAGDMDFIISEINRQKPEVVILDSMSGFFRKRTDAIQSSNIQIRECIAELAKAAKEKNVTIFALANNITSSTMREYETMSYFFDSILSFEDILDNLKLVRVKKSRNSQQETAAVFYCDHNDLRSVPASEYERIFSAILDGAATGYKVGKINCFHGEGGIGMYNELQSIVGEISLTSPRWDICPGISRETFETVAMIVEKYNAINLHDKNISVKLKSAVSVTSESFELPLAASVISSYYNIAVSGRVLIIGGIDYSGAVTPVNLSPKQLDNLVVSGFKTIISSNLKKENFENRYEDVSFYNIQNIKYLRELLSSLSLEAEKTNG